MAVELSTPSFKPREYEGEHISYTLYGLDSDGDVDDLITSPKKSTITHTIKELLPDYRRVYNGMHAVAVLYDKNGRKLDSEVVWSTDQNEQVGGKTTCYVGFLPDGSKGRNVLCTIEHPFDSSDLKFYPGWNWRLPNLKERSWTFTSPEKADRIRSRIEMWADRLGDGDLTIDEFIAKVNSINPDESKVEESLEYEKGHKNSKGEDAPWVIRDHKGGKVLASFSNKKDAEAHLERMKHYAKEALSRHEVLDTAGFSRFVRSLMDAALDRFDDATWDRIVKGYDFGDDFEKGRSVPDTISRLQGWVAATEKMDNSKSEKLFSVPELEKYAMENYVKAVNAAFEKAGVKNFKIESVMRKEKPYAIDVYPKTPSGASMDVSWRILPDIFIVAQYSTDRNGSDTVEREIPFKDDSDIEAIFLDEFKTLEEVLAEGKPSESAGIPPIKESRPTEREVDTFLHNALDWASIDDGENRVILKFIADSGSFELIGYNGRTRKTIKSGELFAVVDRFRELVEMDPADAIREFEKE